MFYKDFCKKLNILFILILFIVLIIIIKLSFNKEKSPFSSVPLNSYENSVVINTVNRPRIDIMLWTGLSLPTASKPIYTISFTITVDSNSPYLELSILEHDLYNNDKRTLANRQAVDVPTVTGRETSKTTNMKLYIRVSDSYVYNPYTEPGFFITRNSAVGSSGYTGQYKITISNVSITYPNGNITYVEYRDYNNITYPDTISRIPLALGNNKYIGYLPERYKVYQSTSSTQVDSGQINVHGLDNVVLYNLPSTIPKSGFSTYNYVSLWTTGVYKLYFIPSSVSVANVIIAPGANEYMQSYPITPPSDFNVPAPVAAAPVAAAPVAVAPVVPAAPVVAAPSYPPINVINNVKNSTYISDTYRVYTASRGPPSTYAPTADITKYGLQFVAANINLYFPTGGVPTFNYVSLWIDGGYKLYNIQPGVDINTVLISLDDNTVNTYSFKQPADNSNLTIQPNNNVIYTGSLNSSYIVYTSSSSTNFSTSDITTNGIPYLASNIQQKYTSSALNSKTNVKIAVADYNYITINTDGSYQLYSVPSSVIVNTSMLTQSTNSNVQMYTLPLSFIRSILISLDSAYINLGAPSDTFMVYQLTISTSEITKFGLQGIANNIQNYLNNNPTKTNNTPLKPGDYNYISISSSTGVCKLYNIISPNVLSLLPANDNNTQTFSVNFNTY